MVPSFMVSPTKNVMFNGSKSSGDFQPKRQLLSLNRDWSLLISGTGLVEYPPKSDPDFTGPNAVPQGLQNKVSSQVYSCDSGICLPYSPSSSSSLLCYCGPAVRPKFLRCLWSLMATGWLRNWLLGGWGIWSFISLGEDISNSVNLLFAT